MFNLFIEKIFFNRIIAFVFCFCISTISYILEIYFNINNLFSSSGTFFTIAGLFLNIKRTNIFHLKLNGKKLQVISKFSIISGGSTFFSNASDEEMNKKVKNVELDEKFGLFFIIIGTLLWGYGVMGLILYLILYLRFSIYSIFYENFLMNEEFLAKSSPA